MQWPMSHHRLERGGAHVGVLCCHEPDGDEVVRDLRRAAASQYAAECSARELQPPRTPQGYPYSGNSDLIDTDAAIVSFSPFPVVLVHGGAAAPVVVTGVNFTAADVFTYGAAGITDDSAPVLTGSTEWDLSVKASVGTSSGSYDLVFGTQIWRALFNVV
jgi:hypothetical protein